MKHFAATLIAFALVAPFAAAANAQNQPGLVRPQLNPSLSLSAPAANPLQAQMREDYATQLRQNQRELLQQNPSGLTRDELAVGHELNGYVAPR